MGELVIGRELQTKKFKTVSILEKLGEGGQGIVYRVDYDGQAMALKWYFSNKLRDPQKFYKNIENNINNGCPAPSFLWPEDITEWIDGTFGYIMPLRPKEFGDFSKHLLARTRFKSVKSMVSAALNIVESFMILHSRGYNYQDLNDGNFFVNFETGDVLICDNDNVMGQGYNSGIAGKCRYMAPEVVCGKKTPDKQTDRYSLAVVLFLLLIVDHPLEGKATYPPCMTEELEKKFYGSDPLFIFDPEDDSNIPIRGINRNAIARWPLFPQYLRDAFTDAFCQDQLHARKPRIMDSAWLKLLIRLRSEIVTCPGCGVEVFADPTDAVVCEDCGCQFRIPAYLEFGDLNAPLYPGVNLYACHTESGSQDFRTPTAEVILGKNDPNIMGIRNLSSTAWIITGADGKAVQKNPNEVVKVAIGLTIDFGNDVTAKIVRANA